MNYKTSLFCLIVLVILMTATACETPNLNGHWHIEPVNPSNQIFGSNYTTLDILDDTLGIIDKGFYGGINGWVSFRHREMFFGGECLLLNYKFKIVADTLYLEEIEYEQDDRKQFVAKRCGIECCNKQQDYFNSIALNIDIDLPSITDSIGFTKQEKVISPISLCYFLGKSRSKEKKPEFGLTIHSYPVEINADSIKHYEDWQKLKIPEKYQDYAERIIFIDKETPKSQIDKLFIEFQKIGVTELVVALREEDFSQELNVWFKVTYIEEVLRKDTHMTWGAFITQNDPNG